MSTDEQYPRPQILDPSRETIMSKTCFVIMPFRPDFDRLYEDLIAPIVTDHHLSPVRADRIYSTRPIIGDIIEGITNATVVIADATGQNPNVNYELGVAHTLGKPTIIIAQSRED